MEPAKRIRCLSFVVVLACAAMGCGSSFKVASNFDPQTTFNQLHTYAWYDEQDDSQTGSRGVSPRIRRAIERAVDMALTGRGFQKTGSAEPDFYVNFYAWAQEGVDVRTVARYEGELGFYMGTEDEVRQWGDGTLILDVLDGQTKKLVWRGWANGAVDDLNDPEKTNAKINEAVTAILDRFPPDQTST